VLHFDDQSDVGTTTRIVKDLISQRAIAILAAPTGSSTFFTYSSDERVQDHIRLRGIKEATQSKRSVCVSHRRSDETATEDLIEYAVTKLGPITRWSRPQITIFLWN